jgi:DNA-binding MarR family transcriptional regulator
MDDSTDPILSLDTANELILAIGQLRRRIRAVGAPGDLNLSQTSTLLRLDQDGWSTTADLARAESMKPQSMGTILSSFETHGLVQRRPHPTDGRQVQFALTEKGMTMRRAQTAARREWLLEAITRLDAAERQSLIPMIALLKKLGV